jgi:hypothetical protein
MGPRSIARREQRRFNLTNRLPIADHHTRMNLRQPPGDRAAMQRLTLSAYFRDLTIDHSRKNPTRNRFGVRYDAAGWHGFDMQPQFHHQLLVGETPMVKVFSFLPCLASEIVPLGIFCILSYLIRFKYRGRASCAVGLMTPP